MKDHLTDLIVLLDACEAAEPLCTEVLRGYNTMVKAMREIDGELRFTTVVAGEEPRTMFTAKAACDVPALTRRVYTPKGDSTLLNALQVAIDETGIRLSAMQEEERPSKVIVVVVSLDKNGHCGDKDALRESITHQQDVYNWSFLYVGVGAGGAKHGAEIGIHDEGLCAFAADANGVSSAFAALAEVIKGLSNDGLPENWQSSVAKRAKRVKRTKNAKNAAAEKQESEEAVSI